MKRLFFAGFFGIMISLFTPALASDIVLDKGTVLVYAIKERGKNYDFTITITSWTKDTLSFDWLTNEKPKGRKGSCMLHRYYTIGTNKLLMAIPPQTNEKTLQTATRIVMPATLNDFLLDVSSGASFLINESEKAYNLTEDDFEAQENQEKQLRYNSTESVGMENLTEIDIEKYHLKMGVFMESTTANYFVAYYQSPSFEMDLKSIMTNPAKRPKEVLETKLVPKPKDSNGIQASKMDAAKLMTINQMFPLLGHIEIYDVTNGGKTPKPFSETYDFREASHTANPPSNIDCLTADLKILYNQKEKLGITGVTEAISNNRLPTAVTEKLLTAYLNKEARSLPGYRPYTHWKLVRALSIPERTQLARELEGYVAKYGFIE